MFLKTLAFIIIMYLLIKFIGRLFLPSPSSGRRPGNFRVFYRVFQNIRKQQKRQQQQQQSRNGTRHSQSRPDSPSGRNRNRFDEIEEAEFEEITEPKETDEK